MARAGGDHRPRAGQPRVREHRRDLRCGGVSVTVAVPSREDSAAVLSPLRAAAFPAGMSWIGCGAARRVVGG
jgi:hypothetical protein